MSKALSAFYDHLLPELPGCSTNMVDKHLLAIAREVCDRAGVWRQALGTITSEPDRTEYPLTAPVSKAEISRVMRLTWGGQLQWSATEVPHNKPILTSADIPRYPVQLPPFDVSPDGTLIELSEQPDGDIQIEATLRPALVATTLPDQLLNTHLELVRLGVLSRLMRMGKKPWSNPVQAADYGTGYDARLNHGALNAERGNTRAPLRSGRTFI